MKMLRSRLVDGPYGGLWTWFPRSQKTVRLPERDEDGPMAGPKIHLYRWKPGLQAFVYVEKK